MVIFLSYRKMTKMLSGISQQMRVFTHKTSCPQNWGCYLETSETEWLTVEKKVPAPLFMWVVLEIICIKPGTEPQPGRQA